VAWKLSWSDHWLSLLRSRVWSWVTPLGFFRHTYNLTRGVLVRNPGNQDVSVKTFWRAGTGSWIPLYFIAVFEMTSLEQTSRKLKKNVRHSVRQTMKICQTDMKLSDRIKLTIIKGKLVFLFLRHFSVLFFFSPKKSAESVQCIFISSLSYTPKIQSCFQF
jgi:hypothetical protein